MKIENGSLLLFRLFGVNVWLNWTWLIGLVIFLQEDHGAGVHSLPFFIGIYLCLFAMVLTHEFGHSLATKSVGGISERIVLTPFGGIAYVNAPQRPGATLWSIAAGPLVNVIFVPITIGLWILSGTLNASVDAQSFIHWITYINLGLLIFNMLPIYPLDGGQILRSLLWFFCGRGLSLIIAASIGIVGMAALLVMAAVTLDWWLALIVLYLGGRTISAVRQGVALYRMERMPRRMDVQCPACKQHPPVGAIWRCSCGLPLDTFQNAGHCPQCGQQFQMTACPLCGKASPFAQWYDASMVIVTPFDPFTQTTAPPA